MTLWLKCILGPEKTVACASCRRKVGVPWGAVAAALPVAVGLVIGLRLEPPWSIVAITGGIVVYVALQRFVVPLVARDA